MQVDIVKEFKLPKQTLSNRMKNKSKILSAFESSCFKFAAVGDGLEPCAELGDDEIVRQVLAQPAESDFGCKRGLR